MGKRSWFSGRRQAHPAYSPLVTWYANELLGKGHDAAAMARLRTDAAQTEQMFRLTERVFETLVRRRFSPFTDVREIAEFVRAFNAQLSPERRAEATAAEALIRAALGETEVSTAKIDGKDLGTTYYGAARMAVEQLGMTEAEIFDLVRAATI